MQFFLCNYSPSYVWKLPLLHCLHLIFQLSSQSQSIHLRKHEQYHCPNICRPELNAQWNPAILSSNQVENLSTAGEPLAK